MPPAFIVQHYMYSVQYTPCMIVQCTVCSWYDCKNTTASLKVAMFDYQTPGASTPVSRLPYLRPAKIYRIANCKFLQREYAA